MGEEKREPPVRIVILMGVSGSGKTTIGRRLARDLGWEFFEGDDFHPHPNIAKMNRGVSLTDQDRDPWLQTLQELIQELVIKCQRAVIACSALRQEYRARLTAGYPQVAIIYLKGDPGLIHRRLQMREDHFMKTEMLDSQLDTLEEPWDAPAIDVDQAPDAIVQQIKQVLPLTTP